MTQDGSPRSNNWPFSPSSPSRIDPLGPISGGLPRPTSGGGFVPGKSLLKDVVGKRFTNSGSPESGGLRPGTGTLKGRVRFKSNSSFRSNGERPNTERRMSQGSTSATDTDGIIQRSRSDSAPDPPSSTNKPSESDTDGKEEQEGTGLGTAKRKAMMLLGKRVLNGLKG